MLSKKDLITINMEFHNGKVMNQGSLDYTIDYIRRSNNWLKSAAFLARAILIDHIFEDGNKRTAAAVIMTYMEMNSIHFNPDRVSKLILQVIIKNITDIRKIERMIKNVIE